MVISGGMHGDEINGVMVCRKLIKKFQDEQIEKALVGKITIIPILNPL
jgi:predicted deacylase